MVFPRRGPAARSLALALALLGAASASLPAKDGYRCLTMGILAVDRCCDDEAGGDSTARLGQLCCQREAAPALEVRAGDSANEPRPSAPPLIATLSLPGHLAARLALAGANPARARGQPPSGSSLLHTTVLRL